MDRISRMLQNAGPGGGNMTAPTSDAPQVDTAEQISISSLALLKMLKHGASWPVFSIFAFCLEFSRNDHSQTATSRPPTSFQYITVWVCLYV